MSVTAEIDSKKPVVEFHNAMPKFYYKQGQGAELEGMDLGMDNGVKLRMSHHQYGELAILLDADKTTELAEWLLRSMAQPVTRLPIGFPEMIRRLHRQKGLDIKLRPGDKQKFRDTIKIFKEFGQKGKI